MHFKIEILQQIIDIVCLNCIEKCCIVITFENIFLDPKNLGMNDKYKSNIYRKHNLYHFLFFLFQKKEIPYLNSKL